MAGALRALGGAFKAGLSPAVGVSLGTDGVTLARFEKKKKSVELSSLVHWELPLPEEISRKEIRRLAKQLMRGVAAARLKVPDISLALPTRYLQLATIVDEYQLPKELKNETDLDPIAYFNDLEESDVEIPDGSLLHYEVFENDKKLDRFIVKAAWVDGAKVEPLIELARQSGLNPVVVDVEIFSVANMWCAQRASTKDLFQKPIAFLEVTDVDAHLLVIRADRWSLTPVSIHEGDKVLLQQAAQLQGDLGPFWTEVFDRAYDSVARALNQLNDWPGAVQLEALVMMGYSIDLTRFAAYAKEQHGQPAEVFGLPDTLQVSDQAIRYFDSAPVKNKFLPASAVSLRTMNPFSVPQPPNEILKLNFLPEWKELSDTRVYRSSLKGVNVSLILLLLGVIAYSVLSVAPILTGDDLPAEVRKIDQQLETESLVSAQTQKDIQSTQALLNGFNQDVVATGKLADFWQALAPALPAGIVLQSAAFERAEGGNSILIEGLAANQVSFVNFEATFANDVELPGSRPERILPEDAPDEIDPEAPVQFRWKLELGS